MGGQQSDLNNDKLSPFCCNSNLCNNDNNIENKTVTDSNHGNLRKNNFRSSNQGSSQSAQRVNPNAQVMMQQQAI